MHTEAKAWRARGVAWASAASFSLFILTQFVCVRIYPTYSAASLCNAFRHECGRRAHLYWAMFFSGAVFLLLAVILLVVAITRWAMSRESAE